MSRAQILEVGEIEAMLAARVESLCWELFPNGSKQGSEFRVGSLGGEPGQSLAIRLRDGARPAGTWADFAGGGVNGRTKGDCLWLIACALFAGDMGKAVAWAKSWLHVDELDPARIEQHRLEAQASAERRSAEAIEQLRRTQASARKRWHLGQPIGGTMAETYLRGRNIDLRALGKAPGALRFNAQVQHGYGPEAKLLPAMLAQVNNLGGEHVATHRTWLAHDGAGGVRKAGSAEGVPKPKKVLGPFEGGHIPLWKGACGSMPLRDVPAGTDVYVSEGIEDGLTAACADQEIRAIAAISVANIGALELPPQIGWLVILAQNDAPGSSAELALQRAIGAQRTRGVRVKVARPPRDVKDVNALAMETAAMESAA